MASGLGLGSTSISIYQHVKNMLIDTEPMYDLMYKANMLYQRYGRYPSLQEIINDYSAEVGATLDDCKSIIGHSVVYFGLLISVGEAEVLVNFRKKYGKLPLKQDIPNEYNSWKLCRDRHRSIIFILMVGCQGPKPMQTLKFDVKKLNVKKFDGDNKEITQYGKTCSICHEDMKSGDNVCVLKCGHVFHLETTLQCGGMKEYAKHGDFCPTCRKKIVM